MKQVQLLYSNNVLLEDSRNMRLDYSLTEKVSEADQLTPFYGVQVTKYLGDLMESEEAWGISDSKDIVVSILKKLHHYQVTPISMVEIVDELVTQEQTSSFK